VGVSNFVLPWGNAENRVVSEQRVGLDRHIAREQRRLHNEVLCNVYFTSVIIEVGYAVPQLVEALRYKLEGRGFDSLWNHWNFSVT
jgi:hypothetical protein